MTVTQTMRAELEREFGTSPYVRLLTIITPETTLRFARNPTEIISNGETYNPVIFEAAEPGDGPEGPQTQITVENVSRAVGQALIDTAGPIEVRLASVLASDPDDVRETFEDIFVASSPFDAETVALSVDRAGAEDEPFPNVAATKERVPGLWL